MTKIHDKVVSESNKPSLKKAKQETKKAVRVLTKDEYTELHDLVILPFMKPYFVKGMLIARFSSKAKLWRRCSPYLFNSRAT